MNTKRITSICAICKKVFEIGDNDKVFFDCGETTRTVCLSCQKKLKEVYTLGEYKNEL